MKLKINREKLATLSPEQQREIESDLAALDAIVEDNPLQVFFPNNRQRPFLESDTRIKAFLGGNRSGKTTAGIVDDLIQAVDGQCVPDSLIAMKRHAPPFRCRIIAPDFTETMQKVVFDVIRKWAPKHQLFGGSWDNAYYKQQRVLRFQNGSMFSFMTFEQDLDKFGGAALHRVHYDEEPPEAIRKESRARLIDYGGDELFTMTPLHGMTWMYDEVYERREEEGVTVVEVATDDNAHNLNMEAMEEFFSSLTPEEREARRKGRFVHFGGLVLQGFNHDRHVVDPPSAEKLKGQTIIVGIDPGIARGGVLWAAFDRDDLMLIFEELYPRHADIPTIAGLIAERNRHWGIEPDYYVIDPSGRNRMHTGHSVEDEFAQVGIPCTPGQNARDTSIRQLRRRLWAKPHPALLVSRDCAAWRFEAGRWRVAEDEESGQDRREGDTFKTVGPDHLMDTTRYLAMERFWGAPDEERPRHGFHGTRVHSNRAPRFRVTTPNDSPPTGALT